MIIKDFTINGTRYMVEGLITKVNEDGNKYHPEEAYNDFPTEDIDEYRVEVDFFHATGGHYWEPVGNCYYDTLADAIEAAAQHAKETTA